MRRRQGVQAAVKVLHRSPVGHGLERLHRQRLDHGEAVLQAMAEFKVQHVLRRLGPGARHRRLHPVGRPLDEVDFLAGPGAGRRFVHEDDADEVIVLHQRHLDRRTHPHGVEGRPVGGEAGRVMQVARGQRFAGQKAQQGCRESAEGMHAH